MHFALRESMPARRRKRPDGMDSDEEGVCEIGSRGSAASTKQFRDRIIAVFNEGVRKGKITLANEWEDEWDPANQNLWQQVAWWIVHGHTFKETVPDDSTQSWPHLPSHHDTNVAVVCVTPIVRMIPGNWRTGAQNRLGLLP